MLVVVIFLSTQEFMGQEKHKARYRYGGVRDMLLTSVLRETCCISNNTFLFYRYAYVCSPSKYNSMLARLTPC